MVPGLEQVALSPAPVMFLKTLYFLSVAWIAIVALVAWGEPAGIAILGIPGFLGLLVTYLKTGKFLLPPK